MFILSSFAKDDTLSAEKCTDTTVGAEVLLLRSFKKETKETFSLTKLLQLHSSLKKPGLLGVSEWVMCDAERDKQRMRSVWILTAQHLEGKVKVTQISGNFQCGFADSQNLKKDIYYYY